MMFDELTPEEKFAHEEAGSFVPKDLAAGVPVKEIIRKLVRLDWSEAEAWEYVSGSRQELVTYHESPQGRRTIINYYFRQMIGGAFLVVAGLVMTVVMFIVGLATGNWLFVVFIGLMLTGLSLFVNGSVKWRVYRHGDLGGDREQAKKRRQES